MLNGRSDISITKAASDLLIVFGLPLVLGFAAAAAVLFLSVFRNWPNSKRGPVIFGLAVAGAVASSAVGVVIGLNLYGRNPLELR